MVFMGMIRYFTLIEDTIHGWNFWGDTGLTIFPVTGVYAHEPIIHFTDQENIETGLSKMETSILAAPNWNLCELENKLQNFQKIFD